MHALKLAQTGLERGQVWRAGLLAAVLAVAVNAVIRTLTVELYDVSPEFRPFTWPQFTLFTLLAVLGATLVYARLLRTAREPAETFRKIAIGVLLVSFLPDVGLFMTQAIPGISLPAFLALLAMHVATAAISVRVLSGCPHFR